MVNLNAPILPREGIGGITLYSHMRDLYPIIKTVKKTPSLIGKFLIRYEIDDSVDLWFNLINGKLFKITALKDYTGRLYNNICIGMHIDDVLKIEPSFVYDDFEEVYCSPKGIYIETDPVEHTVLWISVYIKELESENFEKSNW